ncbi:hypothetical protein [Erwinia sp. E602]|uniref:hypothetical protein n=1 Tax=Erwinia sp. E602 TaxID=2675378 RepID=UPI001BADA2F8|nr:hypothetical protein [Erwinia sp. E602]
MEIVDGLSSQNNETYQTGKRNRDKGQGKNQTRCRRWQVVGEYAVVVGGCSWSVSHTLRHKKGPDSHPALL